ncbi:MAG: integration host factor subunit beta [Thermodesulfatator sp.]|nr:MAG: integration host factor subunit beta [Thermodesulfatator sp.]
MNKSSLIDALAKEMKIHRQLSEFIVNSIFNDMTEALVKGEGIEIRGFGSFSIREYKAYTGRNPKTGEKIKVQPKKLPFFKVGKDLKERVMAKAGT